MVMAVSMIKKQPKIVNNLTATNAGGVLDARQGKVLSDKIPAIFINPTNALLSKTTYVDSEETYTATANGFLFATQSAKPSTTSMSIKINGTNISVSDSDGAYGKCSVACGFIKKGDVIKYNNCVIKIFGLRS